MHRGDLLNTALKLTTEDRNKEYGPPTNVYRAQAEIIRILNYYCPGGNSLVAQATKAALCMIILKLIRVWSGSSKPDSFVDMAAYSAISGEIATLGDATEWHGTIDGLTPGKYNERTDDG